MQDKKKVKIGSRITAIMGAIWLGMTKMAHALTPEDLVVNERMPQLDYGIPMATRWYDSLIRVIGLPIIIIVLFLVGIIVYWKKSKNTKKNKIISIFLFLAIIGVVALIAWGCIYYYAG